MSLLFFISGLFVLTSLQKKGNRTFLQDRFNRLFIPFILGVTILALIAYYPSYYLAHAHHNFQEYIVDFFTIESWPPGPPWFLWVLFLFNLVFIVIYPRIKGLISRVSESLLLFINKPILLIVFLYFYTWILYVPMRLLFGPDGWFSFGPFDFQISRLILYFGYFLLGTIVGNISLGKGLLSEKSSIMQKWPWWIIVTVLTFVLLLLVDPMKKPDAANVIYSFSAYIVYCSVYVACCMFSCIAFLTTAKVVFTQSNSWWDSLTANSFTIYLIHYVFIIWAQYLLLKLFIPAFLKFLIVFLSVFFISWLVSNMVRKNSRINRLL